MEKDKIYAHKVDKATMLPQACYAAMFLDAKVFYANKMLSSRIILTRKGQPVRAIEVGDYLYIAQDLQQMNEWGALARAGHKILWIIHRPTSKVVGKVVDTVVTRL